METRKFYRLLLLAMVSICGVIFVCYSALGIPTGNEVVLNKLSNDHANGVEEMTYRELTIDNSSRREYKWPDDPLCSKHAVTFGKNIDAAWLLSYPRSGNTWSRYLIESSTGIYTGTIYKSQSIKRLGRIGTADRIEGINTIVVKTHSEKDLQGSHSKTIIIMRNPARSIISYWNYKSNRGSTLYWTKSVPNSSYTSEGFHQFVREQLKVWRATYIYPLKYMKHLHVVFYEMIRENPLREIRGILQFLQLRPDEDRLQCLSRHLEGFFMGSQRKVEPYTDKEKEAFARTIEEISGLLRSRGFPPLPDYQIYGLV
ncbi:sialate:O-sulfotransferase 1-like [Palaemon carinicauda]|uniref:sialate:O-sulfotransferase 1-like n=1 Tax=Palaemon carinicauda TaxID=392227 RepID=UPI0035B5E729